jgi:hypothetical protein
LVRRHRGMHARWRGSRLQRLLVVTGIGFGSHFFSNYCGSMQRENLSTTDRSRRRAPRLSAAGRHNLYRSDALSRRTALRGRGEEPPRLEAATFIGLKSQGGCDESIESTRLPDGCGLRAERVRAAQPPTPGRPHVGDMALPLRRIVARGLAIDESQRTASPTAR